MTDITRALAIDGWMTEQELLWLAQRASEHERIVEIGSHLGRSTRALLDNTNGVVFAVDDWRGPRDVYLSKEIRDGIFPKFLENTKNTKGLLQTIPGDYQELYAKPIDFVGICPDMVFIDGSHEYEDVKRDIKFWKEQILSGGLLCGHDVNWSSVQDAILETLGDVEIADGTTIWFTNV